MGWFLLCFPLVVHCFSVTKTTPAVVKTGDYTRFVTLSDLIDSKLQIENSICALRNDMTLKLQILESKMVSPVQSVDLDIEKEKSVNYTWESKCNDLNENYNKLLQMFDDLQNDSLKHEDVLIAMQNRSDSQEREIKDLNSNLQAMYVLVTSLQAKVSQLETTQTLIQSELQQVSHNEINTENDTVDVNNENETNKYDKGHEQMKISTSSSLVTTPSHVNDNDRSTENGDHEYFIMFHEQWSFANPELYVYARQAGNIDVYSFLDNTNKTVHVKNGGNVVSLSKSVLTSNGKERKGIYIYSTLPITLYGFINHIDASDGFFVIPTKFLGSLYIVPSFKVYLNDRLRGSVITLVGTVSNTTVSIKFRIQNNHPMTIHSKQYRNGDVFSFLLSKYETFQISHNYDLSGSVITSSNPVGVISGNICGAITRGSCNPFTEMILPANQLDTIYIVPYIHGRVGSYIRVYCLSNCQLEIAINTKNHTITQKDSFYEFISTGISFIKSNNTRVLVTMIPKETPRFDTYMMTVIGINQYKSEYDFVVPGGFTSYISVSFKNAAYGGFLLDHSKIAVNTIFQKTIDGRQYVTFSCPVTSGGHTITHESGLKFGLWIYGDRNNDGYGFPGGMAYNMTS